MIKAVSTCQYQSMQQNEYVVKCWIKHVFVTKQLWLNENTVKLIGCYYCARDGRQELSTTSSDGVQVVDKDRPPHWFMLQQIKLPNNPINQPT